MNNFKILILLIIVTFFALSSFAQDKSKSKKLDAMIEKGIKEWQIPGLTAIVVKDGEIVFNKVYGIKDIESKEPVDDNTLLIWDLQPKHLLQYQLVCL